MTNARMLAAVAAASLLTVPVLAEDLTIAESTSMKMMGRSMDSSREAVEIKKGPIPAAAFDVAAITKGYKKVAHPITKLQ